MVALNVEVQIKSNCKAKKSPLSDEIKKELEGTVFQLGESITTFKSPVLSDNILSIRLCDFDTFGSTESPDEEFSVDSKALNIFFYDINCGYSYIDDLGEENEDNFQVCFISLPCEDYDGLWNSLIFDSNVKQELVQYTRTMLHYARCQVNPDVISCSRLILLHGPPGTGKTTLCKALAQKVAIRLQNTYSVAYFVEINAHSLLSKYFSESGKLVMRIFSKIREMASQTGALLFLLIDEVESLTHSRQAASAQSEPSDSFRVVNAVLTNLDSLKNLPNVIVLTTSNLTKAIDSAFLDRADLQVFIDIPSSLSIYCILRSSIVELIDKGLITGEHPEKIYNRSKFEKLKGRKESQATSQLIELSELCQGLSGRAMKKIPLRVHSTLINPYEPCPLIKFLTAMQTATRSQKSDMVNGNGSHIEL